MSRGLIIRSPWIDLILEGKKTSEIRGASTKLRERILLIKSGTGLVVGEVSLVGCRGPFSLEELKRVKSHAVESGVLEEWGGYRQNFLWDLERPLIYKTPVAYSHPQGAVIWVSDKYLPPAKIPD